MPQPSADPTYSTCWLPCRKKCLQQSRVHLIFANLSECPLVPLVFSSNTNNNLGALSLDVYIQIYFQAGMLQMKPQSPKFA